MSETKKIRAAVVGYGNIGHYAIQALEAAPDFEIAGIVRRDPSNVPYELRPYRVVASIKELEDVDVALLCTPTRLVEATAQEILALGIATVDSFDIHTMILPLREALGKTAREHGVVSVIAAGWDPGSDSVVRTLMEAIVPKGITYTNFGAHCRCEGHRRGAPSPLDDDPHRHGHPPPYGLYRARAWLQGRGSDPCHQDR